MLKFVSPCQVAQSYRTVIDQTTQQKINNLLDDGDMLPHQYQSFFKAVRDFMVTDWQFIT